MNSFDVLHVLLLDFFFIQVWEKEEWLNVIHKTELSDASDRPGNIFLWTENIWIIVSKWRTFSSDYRAKSFTFKLILSKSMNTDNLILPHSTAWWYISIVQGELKNYLVMRHEEICIVLNLRLCHHKMWSMVLLINVNNCHILILFGFVQQLLVLNWLLRITMAEYNECFGH